MPKRFKVYIHYLVWVSLKSQRKNKVALLPECWLMVFSKTNLFKCPVYKILNLYWEVSPCQSSFDGTHSETVIFCFSARNDDTYSVRLCNEWGEHNKNKHGNPKLPRTFSLFDKIQTYNLRHTWRRLFILLLLRQNTTVSHIFNHRKMIWPDAK